MQVLTANILIRSPFVKIWGENCLRVVSAMTGKLDFSSFLLDSIKQYQLFMYPQSAVSLNNRLRNPNLLSLIPDDLYAYHNNEVKSITSFFGNRAGKSKAKPLIG